MEILFLNKLIISIMHKIFSGSSKSKTKLSESSMNSLLNGVNHHTRCFQPLEYSLPSEENVELFNIQIHTRVSSDPISSISIDTFFNSI